MPIWSNWAGNQACQVRDVLRPRSRDELQEVIRRVGRSGSRLRVCGTRHSWSALVPTDGFVLSTEHLQGVLGVTKDTITVESGVTSATLNDALARTGRMVWGLTIYEGLTVGGMVMTGSHGSGLGHGALCDQVAAMTLAGRDGELFTVTPEDGEAFRAARLSLGALGAVYAITLRTAPATNMEVREMLLPLSEGLARMEEIAQTNDHVSVIWFPFGDALWFYTFNRTERPVDFTAGDRAARRIREFGYFRAFGDVTWSLLDRAPGLTPVLVPMAARFPREGVSVRSPRDAVHHLYNYPRLLDSEYVIPLERAAAGYGAVIDLVRSYGSRGLYPINMAVHARFVRGGDAHLSPTGGRASACIEAATSVLRRDAEPFYRELGARMMREHHGRPHWGKLFYDVPLVRRQYGDDIHRFEAVRRRLDPGGTFTNDLVRSLLAPRSEEIEIGLR